MTSTEEDADRSFLTVREGPTSQRPIGEIVRALADEDPHRSAISCGGYTMSRQEFDLRTNRLARAYQSMGVEEGSFVTIGLPNGIEFYEATFATWKLGATPQPVSWRLPPRERDEIIDLANPVLVVGVDGFAGGRRFVPPQFEPDSQLSDGTLPTRVAPSLRAMTSGGSTGRPKLIVSNLRGTFDTEIRPMRLQPHQTSLVTGPLYHTASFSNSTAGLLLGQHIVVLERFDPKITLQTIAQWRVNWMLLVPTMMLRMWRVLEFDPMRYDLSSLEVVWHMSAPCPIWLKKVWIELLGPEKLFELYGGTDSHAVTAISGTEWLTHQGSVGRAVVGETKIVDAEGNDVPPGTIGEIYMRGGEGMAPRFHYVGAEARSLSGGWESLGDMGRLDAEGYLYLSDRSTDMILSGGANIYPAEIEAVILEHPMVLSCAVVGLPDEDLGQRVHAVVETGGQVDDDELRAFVLERLVVNKVPRSFRFVEASLRDDAGKVRRSAVRDQEIALGGDVSS